MALRRAIAMLPRENNLTYLFSPALYVLLPLLKRFSRGNWLEKDAFFLCRPFELLTSRCPDLQSWCHSDEDDWKSTGQVATISKEKKVAEEKTIPKTRRGRVRKHALLLSS